MRYNGVTQGFGSEVGDLNRMEAERMGMREVKLGELETACFVKRVLAIESDVKGTGRNVRIVCFKLRLELLLPLLDKRVFVLFIKKSAWL